MTTPPAGCRPAVTGQWRPGELGEDHFRRVMAHGEVWLAASGGRVAGAWELWWEDDAQLNAYYLGAGYHVVGRKEGEPQPGGPPKSFTLLEKDLRQAGEDED
ncbi:hypothetical protein ABZ499_05320 [Streptomyces sp. NPDC019990]|uniref:hypothetical protein n=1 Tax=Streptomyces sp. NPDC019990 TaxID=3154693 RepID=UPI0033F773E7